MQLYYYDCLMIDNELILMEKYKLTPTELFSIKTILLAQEGDYEPLQKLNVILDGGFRLILEKLQSKGIIIQAYKLPKPGTRFVAEDVQFNKNFIKQFYRSSFEIGNELFEAYPQFTNVQGCIYNLRRVSKKFNDLEDAFAKYAKVIKNDPEKHKEIIELIKWGIENGYNFTTLDDFICDRGWIALEAFKNGDGINVNTEAIKMI